MSLLKEIIDKENELKTAIESANLKSKQDEDDARHKANDAIVSLTDANTQEKKKIADETQVKVEKIQKEYAIKKAKELSDFEHDLESKLTKLVSSAVKSVLK